MVSSSESDEEDAFGDQTQRDPDEDAPPKIKLLRQKYPQIIMREFHDDSKWYCDICLSAESEDDDPLT